MSIYEEETPGVVTPLTQGQVPTYTTNTNPTGATTNSTSNPVPIKDQITEILQQLTDLQNKPFTDYPVLTLEEAKTQAQNQYKTPYELLAQQTKRALDLDSERRGLFNSPLAAKIMMQESATIKGKYDTDVATLAQTLVTNSQNTSLQNRQFEQDARNAEMNRLNTLLQALQNERAYADAKKRGGGGGGSRGTTNSVPLTEFQAQYQGAERWLGAIMNGKYPNQQALASDMYQFLSEVGQTMGQDVKQYMYSAVSDAYRKKYNSLGSNTLKVGTGNQTYGTGKKSTTTKTKTKTTNLAPSKYNSAPANYRGSMY